MTPVSVAAIFAHPDDEVLGCGAALALHADRGDTVQILILATGLAARGPAGAPELGALRRQAEAAARVLGVGAIEFGDFPDNAMDTVPLIEVVRTVETFVQRTAPAIIYTHHGGDLNVDHRVTHLAVATACRPTPQAADREIFACEVPSSTEWAPSTLTNFVPTDFVDVSATLDRKVAALKCYADEIRPWPHPRSSEGVRFLARWRGAQCGRDAAESFMPMRRVRQLTTS